MMAMKTNFYDLQDGFHDGGIPLPPKNSSKASTFVQFNIFLLIPDPDPIKKTLQRTPSDYFGSETTYFRRFQ
jgi:hypothetical protein